MTDEHTEEKTAAHTLDQIREGGSALLALLTRRTGELETKISEGDFEGAETVAAEIHMKLKVLGYCQNQLGSLGRVAVMRAAELQEGMVLRGLGTITSLERNEVACVGSEHKHTLVAVKLGDAEEAVNFDGDQEVYVARE